MLVIEAPKLFDATLHALAQAKEREDGHNHHNQPDQVDQTVHVLSPKPPSAQYERDLKTKVPGLR
jgi:hypothetical protein